MRKLKKTSLNAKYVGFAPANPTAEGSGSQSRKAFRLGPSEQQFGSGASNWGNLQGSRGSGEV